MSSSAGLTLIHAAALVPAPWKNGGGVTREIAAGPDGAALDAFDWRLSVADVGRSGAFSRFDGIDRTLVLLAGGGMLLHAADGITHTLSQPLDMAAFAGETPIEASLTGGPTRDFNVMMRRGRARAIVCGERQPAAWTLGANPTFLHCVTGTMRATVRNQSFTLAAGDTLRIDPGKETRCAIECAEASWLRIDILPA